MSSSIWANNICMVCQTKHTGDAECKRHEEDPLHKKREVIFDFLAKELAIRSPSSVDSVLFERYSRAKSAVAGLDCISELKFPWSKTPFWICAVCYECGISLDSADSHIYSSHHKRNYLRLYHVKRYEELMAELKKCSADEVHCVENRIVQTLLYEAKCLSPNDVYIFENCSRQWAINALGLEDIQLPSEYLLEPISDFHELVQCLTCGENFFAYESPEQLQLSWYVHLSCSRHQQCRQISTILQEEEITYKDGIPKYCHNKTDIAFNELNGVFYGPTCGYEFLIDFNESKDCFCSLCFCVVPKHEATEHFSSEFHIERYARRFNPSKLLGAEYMRSGERQEILAEAVLQRRAPLKHRVHNGRIPTLLKQLTFADKRAFAMVKVNEVMIGRERAVWCKECTQYIRITTKESWHDHIMDEQHFEFCTKRGLYYIDENNLVSNVATMPPFRKTAKGWTDKFSVALGRTVAVQDHCYYGLQYIVRDELSRVSICLCCHFITNYEEDDILSTHVRSLDHHLRITHLMNKKFLAVLWQEESPEKQKAYLLDYLKHCKLDVVLDSPLVYDPVSALNANCYGRISQWLIDLSKLPPETRENTLASLKLEDFARNKVPFNKAMRSANVEIRHVGDPIVLFCQECNQAFSTTDKDIKEKFAEHIFSQSHWIRQQSLRENRLDENKRLLNQTSSFIVNPFFQINEKKKVTWKWNENRRAFEFVYAQLGLSDIRERRNFKTKRDLYCNLCAESFKAGKFELEHHIRSFSHVFHYVHVHQSDAVPEIETAMLEEGISIPAKHKNIRRILARALKDYEKEQGEIPIYDLSMKFCELPDVKNVIDSDGQNGISPTRLLNDGAHNFEEGSELFATYAYEVDNVSPAEIQQRLVYLINKSGTDESDLDSIKRKIITATINEEPSSVPPSTSSTSTTANDGNKSAPTNGSSKHPSILPPLKTLSTVKQHSDIINRIYMSSSSRPETSRASGKEDDRSIPSSRSSSRVGRRSKTPPRTSSKRRSKSPSHSHRSSNYRTESRTHSSHRRDSRSPSNRNHRPKDADSVRSSKRKSDSPKPKSKDSPSSSTNKIKINIPTKLTTSETSPSQAEYRIRNAPTDLSKINHDRIDPVDPHAEDPKKVKETTQPNSTAFFNTLDAAHAKAVEEFLSKTSISSQGKTVTTPMVSVASSKIPTGINPAMFGPIPGMIPPMMPGFPMPPFGAIPTFPTNPIGMRAPFMNPSMPFPGNLPFPSVPNTSAGTTNTSTEDVLTRAKMELCQRDLANINSVAELIDYMWNQGFDKIPSTEKPLLFNTVVRKKRGILGCNLLYHIVCYEHPELETFYCGLCNVWTTVSEMFTHLSTSMHRLNYMFRNYKVYHRRAMEEHSGKSREQFLERMADQIWELEGSGQCTNRMRCVLNEGAILRIWPEAINNIDHSWKIMDLDPPKIEPVSSTEPQSTSKTAESDMEVVTDVGDRIRTDLSSKDSRISRFSKPTKTDDSPKISRSDRREYDKREKESRSGKEYRPSGRVSPTSRKRKERSRSPPRRRSRSRSPRRSSRWGSPHPTDRKRRRSRSREKTSEAPVSKSKSPTQPTSSETSKKKSETWDEKAAAFLDRIGNRREAARIYLSALDDKKTSDDSDVHPPAATNDGTFGGKYRLPNVDSHRLSKSSSSTGDKSVEDRLRKAALRGISKADRNEIAAEISKMDDKELPNSSSKDHRSQKSRFELANRLVKSSEGPTDDKAEMRKTIGVIVELQSIFEAEKRVNGEVIFKVCEDMGIAAKDALVNTLLRETAQMYGLDLATAYEEWITRKLMEAQQQQIQRQQEKSKEAFKGGLSSELMDILRKVNMVQQQTTSNSFSSTQNREIETAFGRKPYEPELNADVNFIYNGDDFHEKDDEDDAMAYGSDEGEIQDTSYEKDENDDSLSYSYSKQKTQGEVPAEDDDAAGPGQDFQRFSDEDSDEQSIAAEEAKLEQQRAALQSLAEANGLRPEIAVAAVAAALQQQSQAIIKRRRKRGKAKAKAQERKEQQPKMPNPNLEPLGNVRSFGSGLAFSESGSGNSSMLNESTKIKAAQSSSGLNFPQTSQSASVGTSFEQQRHESNMPFDVGRIVQSFTGSVNNFPNPGNGNTGGVPGFPPAQRPAMRPTTSVPSVVSSPAVSFSASPQRMPAVQQQKQQQRAENAMQRAFAQQDNAPVYQRAMPKPRNDGKVPPPLVSRQLESSGAVPFVNPNVLNIASQVGDDWSCMNSYISNLLKNPKPTAQKK